ncbi:MAG: GNAT family N-acetyltransferase [Bacteroidetes bacterium]|uniref:GNAT family N-acetyltransferase n=1 Tax=Phnomibacter sp. TaxID=2836217 RepID=UPI002FDDB43E|nr:GNAT family N-acetyltransferase [Bacteroidota bacterium]
MPVAKPDTASLIQAMTPELYAMAKDLFMAYQQYLNVDLCFQSFEAELNDLPAMYGPPRGALLLAFYKQDIAGCVALRTKADGICEMKRLYVLPAFQGKGIGKQLATAIVAAGRQLGYTKMVLDTLDRLQPAIQLYEQLGFSRCSPYYHNPLEGVVFMEKAL